MHHVVRRVYSGVGDFDYDFIGAWLGHRGWTDDERIGFFCFEPCGFVVVLS